ncbi:hypothetical protein [Chondromyces crocatus]|uniref:Uncharacterized protein n=1 Tax=Chondromyces crocatus TaxID=52 RepID=A0A0K1ET33_CHOCO|nr:hypothetical protein [Chondromyces crocatus]AKT44065.1 uncharacterized protein CMC5_083030 [Chondromyces crocatus]
MKVRLTLTLGMALALHATVATAQRPPAPGVVRLRIEASKPGVDLYEIAGSGLISGFLVGGRISKLYVVDVARKVCAAPCDRVIDGRAGQDFFFSGDGITGSETFRLNDQTGRMLARVDAGSLAARSAGAVLTYTGGGAVLAGGVVLGVGAAAMAQSSDDVAPTLSIMGGATLGVGVALLIPGILLIATSGTEFTLGRSLGDTALFRF